MSQLTEPLAMPLAEATDALERAVSMLKARPSLEARMRLTDAARNYCQAWTVHFGERPDEKRQIAKGFMAGEA